MLKHLVRPRKRAVESLAALCAVSAMSLIAPSLPKAIKSLSIHPSSALKSKPEGGPQNQTYDFRRPHPDT
jgi:hypothetical protein